MTKLPSFMVYLRTCTLSISKIGLMMYLTLPAPKKLAADLILIIFILNFEITTINLSRLNSLDKRIKRLRKSIENEDRNKNINEMVIVKINNFFEFN